jgi:hypothetical protein
MHRFLLFDEGFIMKKVVFLITLMTLAIATQMDAQAKGLDLKRTYFGGGLGFNSMPGAGSSRGFQFFGGYDFDFTLNGDISSALEIGYTDSGKFDQLNSTTKANEVKGIWLSMVESVSLTNKADMLARLGYDFGDDDGLLLGTGLQYKFDTKVAMRMEYVAREHVNSLQVNVLFKF